MSKVISIQEAVNLIPDNARVMFGGFLGCGTPETMISALIDSEVTGIHLIANDTATPDIGVGRLVVAGKLNEITVSHIGTNPITGQLMNEGKLAVNLVPQGTLAEAIRAKGAGLGGFLTPTGVGTIVAENKQTFQVDDKSYLLEPPIGAEVAVIRAYKADKAGNLVYEKSARNQNPLMAMAGNIVIAEVDEVVEVGELDPECVITPSVFVNYIVEAQHG
ncbi:3-oxoacid CoA-transferase subunit A [Vibrio sinensis]|uniref:3-oxoacid CoA-transferase subunit A n=1 Tax=Vibrio sinensis TaxID=2302434 RepID=A0A3A6QVD2_9VIBR|nr:3-oxoacid CoA-transferase subunit A [Vibrio sinensis]RJX65366.1 3-oxoacid CoA-transferase subunit A [Vibrio sinensis]